MAVKSDTSDRSVAADAWGGTSAFARLYEQARPRLLRVVLRINQRPAEAEEIVQDAFAMAWTRHAQFDARRGSVMGWLVSIAHNHAVDSLRRNGRGKLRQVSAVDDDDADVCDSAPCSAPHPPEQVGRARAAAAVRALLGQLDLEQRTCLTLAYFEDVSHAEIARRMGRPLGTIKSWVRRALLTMRPGLAGH